MTSRAPVGDALDPVRRRLGELVAASTSEGIEYHALADVLLKEYPDDVGGLLGRHLLIEWIRREARKLRRNGVPLIGSFHGKAVQIDFWDLDMFRTAIEHYISPARSNLALAAGLAKECQRIHGVVITVPELTGGTAKAI